jgi:CHAT domain-containing protein
VLAAGPELAHAQREIQALHRLYPQAQTHLGPMARAEAVRDALQGAELAHLAAHGEFRDGGVLFSRLRLADGPLMLCDMEELDLPPRLVVLSACDLGRTGQGDQDAVTGMVGTLLALGAATVIASVTPVGDAEAPAFMTAFHAHLKRGRTPAQALAALPRAPGLAGFNCYGAG